MSCFPMPDTLRRGCRMRLPIADKRVRLASGRRRLLSVSFPLSDRNLFGLLDLPTV